jgi:hypothetical protein
MRAAGFGPIFFFRLSVIWHQQQLNVFHCQAELSFNNFQCKIPLRKSVLVFNWNILKVAIILQTTRAAATTTKAATAASSKGRGKATKI